eukprot:TRINITY_DN53496_c0_g1_i1.p1 TRINITY_DN53496_c0_g1~~TRINITY_DN53496_c0_g1_i1.p1  ORF type:complete len:100 (-),score=10.35 TRINITY_DN53496_c0_g1_i1:90-389(-)
MQLLSFGFILLFLVRLGEARGERELKAWLVAIIFIVIFAGVVLALHYIYKCCVENDDNIPTASSHANSNENLPMLDSDDHFPINCEGGMLPSYEEALTL